MRARIWTGGPGQLAILLGLLALSRLYVGNDTGPMHCAAALGVPVVARFGGGHWPRFVRRARRSFCATQQLPCTGCGWSWLDEPACLTLIETRTLLQGIDWALASREPDRRVHVGAAQDIGWPRAFAVATTAAWQRQAALTDMMQAVRQPRVRLAINVRTLWPDRIGGLESAFRHVMGRLLERHGALVEVTLFTSRVNHGAFAAWGDAVRRLLLPDDAWEAALHRALPRFDVLWCPLFFLEPANPPIPAVVTIPDLQHEVFPEFFTPDVLALRIAGCRATTTHAAGVLTLSEHSRQHIQRTHHLPDDRVHVIALDAGADFARPADATRTRMVRARYGLPERYALFPANNWPHKNHRGLFQALARYRERFGEPPSMVLTGATDAGGIDICAEIAAAGVSAHVRHLGFVDAHDMPALYDGAALLVFATLFEGFGIPLIEAMRRGTPIVAAHTTSVPEVAGDCGLLVDPRDPDAIAAAMHDVVTDSVGTRARVARGLARAAQFSYDAAADATWRVLHDVASRPFESHVPSVSPGDDAPAPVSRRLRPKVLVVTPSLNQGRFLRETIESVLAQGYENLDYVVADGGSTDDSLEILRSYGTCFRWTSGPDGGQAAAIAHAWRGSDADIVAWLNSDDTYLPGAIDAAVDYLLAHPEASMVYGQAWYTNAESQRLEAYAVKPFDRQALAAECFICQPAAFMRRDVLQAVEPPDPALKYCMDYDLWIRLSQHFHLDYIDTFLATSRMHPDNKTLGQRDGVFREIAKVTRRHFGAVPQSWIGGYVRDLRTREEGAARHLPTSVQQQRLAALEDRVRSEVDGALYDDGWAGRRTVVVLECDDSGRVTLECDCPVWSQVGNLTITASAGGQILARHQVQGHDRFFLTLPLPPRSRTAVLLEASEAVIPLHHELSDDARPLSFRVVGRPGGEKQPSRAVDEAVLHDRLSGRECAIDRGEAHAPGGFDDIGAVASYGEREAIARGDATLAGDRAEQVNRG